MRIVAREKDQFRITCDHGHDFKAPRYSISVECPCCGRTDTTVHLIDRLLETMEKPVVVVHSSFEFRAGERVISDQRSVSART